jgi:hypothetical protein
LYGVDFNVTWDKSMLTLAGVNVLVSNIWQTYFIAINDTTIPGNYHLVATALAPTPGFNGTATIATLTFRVIDDPIYPVNDICYISIVPSASSNPMLTDSNGNPIGVWSLYGCTYQLYSVEPVLSIGASNPVLSKVGGSFSVNITVANAIKMNDWAAAVTFNPSLLQVTSVTLSTSFLQGPFTTWLYTVGVGTIVFAVHESATANVANGTGTLATITFTAVKGCIWNYSWPTLSCPISLTGVVSTPSGPAGTIDQGCVYTYKPIPGDVNMDGVVNVLDLKLVAGAYGDAGSSPYDLNCDSYVNLIDITIVAIHYGQTTPGY